MKLSLFPRHFLLLAAMLVLQTVAQAGELHPCGLTRVDPSTIPWMVLDTFVPGAPRRLGVSVDLSSQMPPVGNQGSQGSCAAWATGYYQKTHYEWREYHWDLTQTSHQFSPAFIYNQINGGADQGSSTPDAFSLMTDQGCATMADCPYSQSDYTTWPSESAYARAIPHRAGTSHWFWIRDTNGINQAKQRLDSGYTTVIGIEVYSNFDNIQNFHYTYCVADTYGEDRGSHAVTIIGCNDTMTTHDGTGAFKMINSWGTSWGQSGYWWMSYVAARNSVLSHQVGYYLDDLTSYSPTMIGRVKITHAARDRIGIRLGVGRTSSPRWNKDFRTWRYPRTDQAFPNHNLVFDMTEGEPYITGGQTESVFVRAIDDASDSKTGTINYFAAKHLVWNSTGVSSDTPVTIPDYNTAVYARARIVRPHDVSVTAIVAPTGTVDSGTVVTPRARVKNCGIDTITFPVTFRIGTGYTNTQTVSNLMPGDSVQVSFTNWTALPRGLLATRCSTNLSGDLNRANDTLAGSVTVRVTNVGVTAIVAPADTVDSGSVITPRARVKNYGTGAATFPVSFRIDPFYTDSRNVTNLAAGDSVLVSFNSWTALQRGPRATRCSTALTGDQNHANDALSGSVTVRVTNVGVTAIVAPSGTIDSGMTVTPQARVKNYGTGAATFPVTFRIGSFYSNTQNVTSLAAGDSVQVSFTDWTALQRGTHATRCSTNLTADQVRANDTLSGSVTVRVTNVGVTAILAPADTVDSGTVITPRARVRNYGTSAATFPVTFSIGPGYSNTQNVSSLAPGDSVQVYFANWTPLQLGALVKRCSTALSGDQIHTNDTLAGSVTVVPPPTLDVSVAAIIAPAGSLDSGTTVNPQARVRNYGTSTASFSVFFRIGSFYNDSRNVANLAPGDSALVSFTSWTALERGTHATRCTTALTGDEDRGNDALSGSVTVQVADVGVATIVAPPDTVDSGAVITPQTWVRNHGTDAATFPVTFSMDTLYSDPKNVTSLAAGDSTLVSFAAWAALARGTHIYYCATALSGDVKPANDTLRGSVTVRVRDIACARLLAPPDTVDSGEVVTPRAVLHNLGTTSETFDTRFTIGADYADTVSLTLASGATDTVDFEGWTASAHGVFPTCCAAMLPTDMNRANDSLADSVIVTDDAGVAELQILPRVLALERPRPDPMRGTATIRLSIPARMQANLTVRSVTGTLVRTLCNSSLLPAIYSLSWDGRDDHGRSVAPGIYFWRLEAENKTLTRKAVKLN